MRSVIVLIALLVSLTAVSAVTVPGDAEWVPSGIVVEAGDELDMTATGDVFYNHDGDSFDPDGVAYDDFHQRQADTLCPDAPNKYMLVGRIGSECFGVGSEAMIEAPASGEIEFGFNDVVGGFWDNSGSYEVDVDVTSVSDRVIADLTARVEALEERQDTHQQRIEAISSEVYRLRAFVESSFKGLWMKFNR